MGFPRAESDTIVFTSTVDTQFLDCCPGETPREEDDEDDVIDDDDRVADVVRDSGVETTRALATCDTGRAYPVGAVLGSYRLLQQIGAGGMGRVFVAEHVRLGRRVALKVLRSEFSGNLEAVKRFFAEAHAVNCISHENIIEVSDFVESRHGPSFYIMELLHGQDLRAAQEREGILSLDRILRIGAQICSGLGAAHAGGIVHRDLKPDNIFLIERNGQRDFVKLLDFGVAKLMNANFEEAATFRSTVGMVVGTPDYMAPEQALGHQVDHRADIYATGVILYEMVAGRRPFVANSAREVMVQHLTTTPCRPSRLNPAGKIPEELEDLILACLAKEPAHRPQDIREVEQRLRDILAGSAGRGGAAPARPAAAEIAQARRRGGADGAASRRRPGSAAAPAVREHAVDRRRPGAPARAHQRRARRAEDADGDRRCTNAFHDRARGGSADCPAAGADARAGARPRGARGGAARPPRHAGGAGGEDQPQAACVDVADDATSSLQRAPSPQARS